MSGVMGYRMKSYGPRCLMKLKKNETVLDRQLSVLNEVYKNARIIVSAGFESEKVIKSYSGKVSLIEHQYYYQNNEGDEVRLAVNSSTANHILIVGGHVLFNQEVIRQINLNESGIVIDKNNHISKDNVGVNHNEETVSNLSYGLDDKWGYITYLTGKELDLFRLILQKEQCTKHFLFEIVNATIDSGGKMKSYYDKESQLGTIDSYVDFLALQEKEYNYV